MDLLYKGYRGELLEDGSSHVVAIADIADTVTAPVEDLSLARDVFRDLVEDYLATCVELGKEPSRPRVLG